MNENETVQVNGLYECAKEIKRLLSKFGSNERVGILAYVLSEYAVTEGDPYRYMNYVIRSASRAIDKWEEAVKTNGKRKRT